MIILSECTLFMCGLMLCYIFFFFKQKTAYEMRISDWSSDVCSSDLFTEARYVILASAVGLAVFILATWLPNFGLVWQIAASGSVPLADKVEVLAALVGSIATNFTVFSALSTITIAALFGANVAMITYQFRLRRQLVRQDRKSV